MKKELIQAVKDNRLYDFLANEYYKFDKEDLKRIAMELAYLLPVESLTELAENLDEYIVDDE